MNEKAPEDCISQGEDGSEHGGRTEEFCNGHNYTLLFSTAKIEKKIEIWCIYSHKGVSIR